MPRAAGVTLADLVLLSLLAEKRMHGYELWAELERRQVEKWASISRAQVYYSLRKLADARALAVPPPPTTPPPPATSRRRAMTIRHWARNAASTSRLIRGDAYSPTRLL